MLSNQNVLPNFLKTVLFASATALSMNAFAGNPEASELKDMSAEESTILTGEATDEVKAQEEAEAKARLETELNKAPQK